MNKRRARNPFRLLLALVAAGALCAVGGAAFCSSAQPAGTATGYVSPYDWAGLERDGDRLACTSRARCARALASTCPATRAPSIGRPWRPTA